MRMSIEFQVTGCRGFGPRQLFIILNNYLSLVWGRIMDVRVVDGNKKTRL
jgi:hypothetical protein